MVFQSTGSQLDQVKRRILEIICECTKRPGVKSDSAQRHAAQLWQLTQLFPQQFRFCRGEGVVTIHDVGVVYAFQVGVVLVN